MLKTKITVWVEAYEEKNEFSPIISFREQFSDRDEAKKFLDGKLYDVTQMVHATVEPRP